MKSRGERRRSPRLPSRFPLRYRLVPVLPSGYQVGRVEDLSLEGARFICRGGVRPRTGFLFEMLLPGREPVRSFARAAWVRELPLEGYEVGSGFVDQSTAARQAIARHLQGATSPAGA